MYLHEMGGENAPLIAARAERRYRTRGGDSHASGFVISGTKSCKRRKDNGERQY